MKERVPLSNIIERFWLVERIIEDIGNMALELKRIFRVKK